MYYCLRSNIEKYIITLAVTPLFSCHAMDVVEKTKARPADPLKWARHLVLERGRLLNPSILVDDMIECRRRLDGAVSLQQLNECELKWKKFTSGDLEKQLAALQQRVSSQKVTISGMQDVDKLYRPLLVSAKEWLAAISKPTDNVNEDELATVNIKKREEILLTEMVSILTRHVYADGNLSEGLKETRNDDYRRIRDLLDELFEVLAIEYCVLNEPPASVSSEEELIGPVPTGAKSSKEAALEKLSQAESLVWKDQEGAAQGFGELLQHREEASASLEEATPSEGERDSSILGNIEDADTAPPLTKEQRSILRYLNVIKKIAALKQLLEANQQLIIIHEEEFRFDEQELAELEQQKQKTKEAYLSMTKRAESCAKYSTALKKFLEDNK